MWLIDWFRNRWMKPPEWLVDADDDEDITDDNFSSGSPESLDNVLEDASRYFRQGDIESGVRACQQALKTRPESAGTCIAVGRLQLQHGIVSAAEGSFRLALQRTQNLPEAHFYLASSLVAQDRLEEATESFQACIRLDPMSPSAHNDLGATYRNLSKFNEAIASCKRAIEIDPSFAHAHNNLGLALWQLGKFDEAMDSIQKAISLDPEQASFHNNIGIICFEKGDLERSESEFLRSLSLAPAFFEPIVNLATIYEATYRLDEAWSRIEQGLSINPDDPRLHLCAARCELRRGEIGKAMQRLTSLPIENLALSTRAQIEKEIALLLVRDGQHQRAFEYATKANNHTREVASALGVDKQDFLDEIDSVSRWLTPEKTQTWKSVAETPVENTPIFLVGFPRSGTTLLDQILDSHPKIQTLEESLAVDAMKTIFKGMPDGYPHSMEHLKPEDFGGLKTAYFDVVDHRIDRKPGTVLIDKFPLNLCNAALIYRVFPRARFLFSLRHPCDVCLSAYMQNFKLNSAMACFLDLNDAATLYEKSMTFWQQCIDVLSLEYHAVRYEDLVMDIETQIRKVLEFIGLAWDDKVLEHLDHARQRRRIATASLRQVTEPIYTSARYRWHHYEQELSPVLPRLQPFVEKFDY